MEKEFIKTTPHLKELVEWQFAKENRTTLVVTVSESDDFALFVSGDTEQLKGGLYNLLMKNEQVRQIIDDVYIEIIANQQTTQL